MTGASRNGHDPDAAGAIPVAADDADDAGEAEAALDALDAEPLDADEAASGAAAAADEVDESLDERIESVIDDLAGVDRVRADDAVTYAVAGRPFARVGDDTLEVGLDATVAKAALRTPDATTSSAGPGWISFTPRVLDRYALDRAEAWVRLAYRRAGGR